MTRSETSRGWGGAVVGLVLLALAPLALAPPLAAQSTKVPSTLRYGTGLLDVPVASVLPAGALTLTYSGFFTSHDRRLLTDERGVVTGSVEADGTWMGDFALAYGLWDLFEVGATVQSLDGEDDGGPIVGGFGRLTLIHPHRNGPGLAFGARFVNGPDFGDGIDRATGRLGNADARFRSDLDGTEHGTGFSFYSVASWDLVGWASGFFPRHDWTLTAGWGSGMFSAGDELEWYEFSDTEGWFAGAALHVELDEDAMLTLGTEYNGFDWNMGAWLDAGGVRIGGHVLGLNYSRDLSLYRSRKFGFSASLALCSGERCRPTLRERVREAPVILPAPPPDTVVIRRTDFGGLGAPEGAVEEVCLSTGESIEVAITDRGDTLVAPTWVSLDAMGPGVSLAGAYGRGRAWFEARDTIELNGRTFEPVGAAVRLACTAIVRLGDVEGVPVFGVRATRPPRSMVYVPVRPGVWRPYRARSP